MNMHVLRRRTLALPVLASVAALAASLPGAAWAADPANLEGTWKIVAPQATFKPEGGSIPFTKDGAARYRRNEELRAKGRYEDFDWASARCATPGTPRLMLTPERFRIWQRPGMVLMQFEWNRQLRQVDMGTLIPQTRLLPGPTGVAEDLTGRSTPVAQGHWEGKTLVAVSSGFNDSSLVDALVPHGWNLKVTEWLGLKDANTPDHDRGSGVLREAVAGGRHLQAPARRPVPRGRMPRAARLRAGTPVTFPADYPTCDRRRA